MLAERQLVQSCPEQLDQMIAVHINVFLLIVANRRAVHHDGSATNRLESTNRRFQPAILKLGHCVIITAS
jgi:hypothetical protein